MAPALLRLLALVGVLAGGNIFVSAATTSDFGCGGSPTPTAVVTDGTASPTISVRCIDIPTSYSSSSSSGTDDGSDATHSSTPSSSPSSTPSSGADDRGIIDDGATPSPVSTDGGGAGGSSAETSSPTEVDPEGVDAGSEVDGAIGIAVSSGAVYAGAAGLLVAASMLI